ncbi:MAG: exosortase/archaeosortase family protein [Dysgonamonadaceae bacterium]|nr:exosortase/archaeosortase family protein [Dysgonamonadaceae bacterium]
MNLKRLSPYKGIALFFVLLLGAHFLWKLFVDGDLHSQQIAIFGMDVTPWFYRLSQQTAGMIHWFVCLFPNKQQFMIDDTHLYFAESGTILNIIWGCTGIKQLYVFLVIMLLYPGPWKKKCVFIPVGCIVLQAYNIFRIACIAWLTETHPERFDSLHDGVFRYLYYGLILLMWIIWEERFRRKPQAEQSETINTDTI